MKGWQPAATDGPMIDECTAARPSDHGECRTSAVSISFRSLHFLLRAILSLIAALSVSDAVWGQAESDSISRVASPLRVTASGTISLTAGQSTVWEDNPLLPQALRRRSTPLLQQQINLHTNVRYEDKLFLDLDYNTDGALRTSKNRLRLGYRGGDYEVLQSLQAGNITFHSSNPLISTPGELFGISGDLWLGRLDLRVVASIQRDHVRRIVVQGGKQVHPFEYRSSDYEVNKHFFLSEFFASRYDAALSDLPVVQSDIKILRVAVWVESRDDRNRIGQTTKVSASRSLSLSTDVPPEGIGEAGDEVEIARGIQLSQESYTVNPALGYISLHFPLSEDQRLAVAYEYLYQGRTYRVGSFEADSRGIVHAALLADRDKSPHSPLWDLMMKNGYSIGALSQDIAPEDLEVQLYYREPSTDLLSPVTVAGTSWMEIMGWDRQDERGIGGSCDGRFDFHNGVTVSPSCGSIFIPRRTPFSSLPEPYPHFSALYEESPTQAKERKELDRFLIRGSVTTSTGQTVALGGHITPGSVTARQGGRTLIEGTDFTMDYERGELQIQSDSEEPVEVSIAQESQTNIKRKSLFGLDGEVELMPNLKLGGTVLTYIEDSGSTLVRMRQEDLRNTMLGAHLTYDFSSDLLARRMARIIGNDPSTPVSLRMRLAYAHLLSGYNMPKGQESILVDDFEEAGTVIDLTSSLPWQLASYTQETGTMGGRGQMAWFNVDPLLVREGEQGQPLALVHRPDLRQDPLVREYRMEELFPKRDLDLSGIQVIPILNLSLYPDERGPYNYQTEGWDTTGRLAHPERSWGAIARPLEIHDFEREHITSLEFWIIDPFFLNPQSSEGELLIDLGRFAEEIISDGALDFESNLPMVDTPYGRRSEVIPSVRAFASGDIEAQDVGLDGLSSTEERVFYKSYLTKLESVVDPACWVDGNGIVPGSPFDDPSGDDYHFYLGETWDLMGADVLQRYKYINGTESNSIPRLVQGAQALRTDLPDTEDLDGDGTLEKREGFFRYHVPVTQEALSEGGRWFAGEMVVDNGTVPRSRWVKLSIPLKDFDEVFGTQPIMQDIGAIRMTLQLFSCPIHLRLAALRLIASPWMTFTTPVDEETPSADLSVKVHSLEEDSGRTPIPYVSPPGVVRDRRRGAMNLIQTDEKALALVLPSLSPKEAGAVYRPLDLDLRHYEEITLFSHAEGEIRDGDLELFIRLGSDYTSNYYEYRHPLTVTPRKDYSGLSTGELQQIIWPRENHISIRPDDLITLKEEREMRGVEDRTIPYTRGRYSIRGYPSLGHITAVMIGVRSRTGHSVQAEVWVNELGVSGAKDMSGSAWVTDLETRLSDLGYVTLKAGSQSAGFGDIRDDVRLAEPLSHSYFALDTRIDIGKILPRAWDITAPIAYSLRQTERTPKYDPYSSDRLYHDGRATTYERTERLRLDSWHPLSYGSKRVQNSARLPDLILSYDLTKNHRYDPQTLDQRIRRMRSTLDYSQEWGSGDYLRLHSGWYRDYDRTLYPTTREDEDGRVSLLDRWAWDRSLRLHWSPIRIASLTLQSSTTAFIGDSPTPMDSETEEGTFRLFTSDILRSIATLGETDKYQGRYTLSLHTPALETYLLRPLYAYASYTGSYAWSRGVVSKSSTSGNEISNNGLLDLTLRYDLGQLTRGKSRQDIGSLQVQYRHSGGSSIPAFLPTAGKAFGFGRYDSRLAPSPMYMLALGGYDSTIAQAIHSGWLLEDESTSRLPSYFSSDDLSGHLYLSPTKGLRLDLTLTSLHSQSHILSNRTKGETMQLSGLLRLSTIGLKKDWTAQLLSDLSEDSTPEEAVRAFLSSYAVSPRLLKGLPTGLNLLPNWRIAIDLSEIYDPIRSILPHLEISHRYQGTLEIPDYQLAARPSGMPYDLRTIISSDYFDPLIGLEGTLHEWLTLSAAMTKRRSRSLMTESRRLLTQQDTGYDITARYRVSLPPLFRSKLSLLSSTSSDLETGISYTFVHTSLEEASILSKTQSHIRGLDTHNLRITLDYHLSQSLSLRGFWSEDIRKPLVTGIQYPYRKSSYGVMLLLSLKP